MIWKKVLTIATLSAVASIAGVQSELLASNGTRVFKSPMAGA